MARAETASARPAVKKFESFALLNDKSVDRFLKISERLLRRLFPELDMGGMVAMYAMLSMTEIANNVRHCEGGRSYYPAALRVAREGALLVVEMQEGAPFEFSGVKFQPDLLNEHGRGMWLTSVAAQASGGRLIVEGKESFTRLEYDTGVSEEMFAKRVMDISASMTPAAETIIK